MLEDIFTNIKENEIVMPDEQKGLVRNKLVVRLYQQTDWHTE